MPLVYSYNSNRGRKEKNDDAVSVSKNKQGALIAIVCDGVGSHSNAAYSSNYIVTTLEKEWQDLTFANFNNMKNWLCDRIEKFNTELFSKSKDKNEKMGTTIVSVAIFDGQVVVYNIEEEAKNHPERHVLTQAIATKENIELHTFIDDLSNYDYFLLCSDGLTNMVENEEIQNIVRNNELTFAVDDLIDKCVKRGGVDNISVAIIKNLRGDNHDK